MGKARLPHAWGRSWAWSAGTSPSPPEREPSQRLVGECGGREIVGLDDASGDVDSRKSDRQRARPKSEQDGEDAEATGHRLFQVRTNCMGVVVHVL